MVYKVILTTPRYRLLFSIPEKHSLQRAVLERKDRDTLGNDAWNQVWASDDANNSLGELHAFTWDLAKNYIESKLES